MMVHPLILAVAAADAAVVVLLLMAALTSARIVTGWRRSEPTREQLRLERRAESASVQGRWAFGLFVLGSLTYLVAVAEVLPAIVPGAMCGTGVVQATNGLADRALGLRLLALLLMGAWRLHDGLDRADPTSPLVPTTARLMLLAAPVAVVAALGTFGSMASLDAQTPVDCCSVVFDQVSSVTEATTTAGLSDTTLARATTALGALLAGLAIWIIAAPGRALRFSTAALGLTALMGVPLAAVALVRVFSAYHYGVLHHHCPWCLLLPEHRLVGFPLFGALLVVLLDGVGAHLAARVANAESGLADAGRRRARTAALRVLLAVVIFAILTGGPALFWRLRYGVGIAG